MKQGPSFVQGTDEWLAWRKQGIGGSEAPVIMGVSPFMTKYQLWEVKTGKANEFVGNFATERGQRLEPKARAWAEFQLGAKFTPMLVEHPTFPFIRASLDGYNTEQFKMLEIKCPGKEDHEKAMAGKVPDKYFPQIQHCLFITGADECAYVSFDGNDGVVLSVLPDREFMARLIEEEIKFWDCVLKGTAPEYCDQDFVEIRSADERKAFENVMLAHQYLDEAKANYEAARAEVLKIANSRRVRCLDVQIYPKTKKGSVEYDKIAELKNVDLDKYRKPPTTYMEVRINAKK